MLAEVPQSRASSWLVSPRRSLWERKSDAFGVPMHAAVTMYGPFSTALTVFRNPLPPMPPAPAGTIPLGRGPKSTFRSSKFLASSLARSGSADGGGGGAGRENLAGAAVVSAKSSVYSHPLTTVPENRLRPAVTQHPGASAFPQFVTYRDPSPRDSGGTLTDRRRLRDPQHEYTRKLLATVPAARRQQHNSPSEAKASEGLLCWCRVVRLGAGAVTLSL
jgi:hypothetical protein